MYRSEEIRQQYAVKNLRTIDCTRMGPAINISWLVDFLTSLAEALEFFNTVADGA